METFTSFYAQLEFLLRLVIACACGGAIGYERSIRQKDAGIRTHIIVSLGATLMMLVSKYGFFDLSALDHFRADGPRVAANIITGVSFLGAGVIFIKNDYIKGLTTAAGIWTTAGVGMAIGSGMYFIGISATALMIFIQIMLHRYLNHLELPVADGDITVKLKALPDAVSRFRGQLESREIEIVSCSVERCPDEIILVHLLIRNALPSDFSFTAAFLEENPDILSLRISG